MRPCIIYYYLVDGTVKIREVHAANDGREPFLVLVCRQRLPKNRACVEWSLPSCVLELSDHENKDWITPRDLMVGQTLFILGRRFLLNDCDEFTKNYYRSHFGINDFSPRCARSSKRTFTKGCPTLQWVWFSSGQPSVLLVSCTSASKERLHQNVTVHGKK